MCDLLWSDPDDSEGWSLSPRGAGFLFGANVAREFTEENGVSYVCRAHQLVMEGYKEHFGGQVVTVWSAPNYCYRCGNKAAILRLTALSDKRDYISFDAAPTDARTAAGRKPQPDYFL